MEKIIVSIPSMNVDGFKVKMDKLIKLSVKLNSGNVSYKLIGEEVREIPLFNNPIKMSEKIKYFNFEITGETPTLNGYQLVAILERQNKLNLINHVNKDIELPEGLVEQANYCEHCNSNRSRKFLFVLFEEETGRYIQVGKTCVKDFTGMHGNPENIAQWYSYLEEISGMEEIDEETYRTSRFDTYMDAKEMIAFSSYFTDKFGFVKKWSGTKENPSTAERTERWHLFVKWEEVEEAGYFEVAEKIMEWITKQDSNNDYMMNLQTLIKEGNVNTRKTGFLASAYNSYLRSLAKKDEEEVEKGNKKPSEYVGEVGKRSDYTLTYDRMISYDSMYGTTRMYFFHDKDDNVFVWKTSNYMEFTAGEVVEMKATLKEHNEYRDVKQNILTRCKVKCEVK